MIFDGKSIKSVANKFLNKLLQSKHEPVEVKADVWKSMYPFFCNQAMSTSGVAIDSLKTIGALVDYGIVGDYKDLQKVLLHENGDVAHLALDILRKIKGLTIETRMEGAKPAPFVENMGEVPQKRVQEMEGIGQFLQNEKEFQSRFLNVLKIEETVAEKPIERKVEKLDQKISEVPSLAKDYDYKIKALEDSIEELKKLVDSSVAKENVLAEKVVTEKLTDVEKKVEKLDQKISEVPSLAKDYDYKIEVLEDSIEELKKLVDSSVAKENVLAEKVVTEKLADIEKGVEKLGQKISDVPSTLTQDYDNKIEVLEDSIEELKKLVDSSVAKENVLAEKVAGQVLKHIKPMEHMPKPSISQFTQKQAENSNAGREGVRLSFLDNTPETSIILLNWVKFLMEKVGRNNLADVLGYYVEIGWISEEVCSVMANYAEGLDYYVETPASDLLPEVHTKSLLFIEQLRAQKRVRKRYKKLSSASVLHGSTIPQILYR